MDRLRLVSSTRSEKYQVYTDFFRAKDVKDPFLACKLVVLDEMANTSYKKLYMTDFMELVLRVSILRYPPRPLTLQEVVKSLQKLFVNHFYKHEALLDQFCDAVDQAVVQDRVEAFATAIASHRRGGEEDGGAAGDTGSSTPRGGSASSRRASRRHRPPAILESPAESQEPASVPNAAVETAESAAGPLEQVDEPARAPADPAVAPAEAPADIPNTETDTLPVQDEQEATATPDAASLP